MTARNIANKIQLGKQTVIIYASPKIGNALSDVTKNLNLYEGVKLVQLLEAMYQQGKKDGARSAFEVLEEKIKEAERQIPHRNPGKPRKKK